MDFLIVKNEDRSVREPNVQQKHHAEAAQNDVGQKPYAKAAQTYVQRNPHAEVAPPHVQQEQDSVDTKLNRLKGIRIQDDNFQVDFIILKSEDRSVREPNIEQKPHAEAAQTDVRQKLNAKAAQTYVQQKPRAEVAPSHVQHEQDSVGTILNHLKGIRIHDDDFQVDFLIVESEDRSVRELNVQQKPRAKAAQTDVQQNPHAEAVQTHVQQRPQAAPSHVQQNSQAEAAPSHVQHEHNNVDHHNNGMVNDISKEMGDIKFYHLASNWMKFW